MNEQTMNNGRPDRGVYVENRSKFPLQELAKYGDQWVAWSLDGTTIVAHHEDLLEVGRILDKAGVNHQDVSFEWIPPGGEVDILL
jgi:hypothetical protein